MPQALSYHNVQILPFTNMLLTDFLRASSSQEQGCTDCMEEAGSVTHSEF